MKNLDTASISRYVVLVIAVINSVLNLVGYQTIDDKITNDLVAVITGSIHFIYGMEEQLFKQ